MDVLAFNVACIPALVMLINSPVSGSLATVAVRPAADEDFPDV
ncbi:hypothetical protein ACJIZ3_013774 [Penstemon smallii]|uniref:Uncharacterized protein n=1 Tax=Penstemon smallii TaxID=265156 RepID=A0ABD3RL53_9LAMI